MGVIKRKREGSDEERWEVNMMKREKVSKKKEVEDIEEDKGGARARAKKAKTMETNVKTNLKTSLKTFRCDLIKLRNC